MLDLPSTFRGTVGDAATVAFRGTAAGPLFHRGAMQCAEAYRTAARDLALLVVLWHRGHRVVSSTGALPNATTAAGLLAQALRSCAQFRCVEWLGGRVAAPVSAT